MRGIDKFLCLPASTLYGVVTFYAQFKFTPVGKNTIKIYRGTQSTCIKCNIYLEVFPSRIGAVVKDSGEQIKVPVS